MTNITTLRPGEHFMFKNFEWVCLDPNHPDGGVLAIMEKPWKEDAKFCPNEQYADGMVIGIITVPARFANKCFVWLKLSASIILFPTRLT